MRLSRMLVTVLALASLQMEAAAQTPVRAPVRIASSLPLTGGSAYYGAQGKNGAELSVSEINAAGGVLGAPVEIDFWDNRCNPAEGVRSVTQALAEKHYTAIHEGGCSSVALGVMPLAERAGVPFVVGSPSATTIAERSGVGGNRFTFKVIPTDAAMLKALVDWIADKNQAHRVAFIGEDTDYGRGGARVRLGIGGSRQGAEQHGFLPAAHPGFQHLITRLQSRKPSLIAVYTIGADSQFSCANGKKPAAAPG